MVTLKTERMVKLTITCPNNLMEKVITDLHDMKRVHITDHTKDDLDIGNPMERSDKISELLVLVKAITASLDVKGENENHRTARIKSYAELSKTINAVHKEVNEKLAKMKEVDDNLNRTAETKKDVEKLKLLPLPLDVYTDYKSIAYFVGTVPEVQKLETELKKLGDRLEIYSNEETVAVFIDEKQKDDASSILTNNGFVSTDLSRVNGLKGMPVEQLEKLTRTEEKLQKEKASVQKQLDKLSKKWSEFLLVTNDLLTMELDKAHAPLKFAATKQAFVIKGWAPENDFEKIERRLAEITKNRVFVQKEEIAKKDSIPIKMNHPGAVKPFEFFIRLYNLPLYKELDPTMILFLTFPFFFGFMLGDMGYGVVSLCLALFLKTKFKSGKNLFNVMIISSVSAIIFGALFGEIFGEEVIFGVALPHILSRAHQINLLLYIAIGIGLIHINLGLIFGFINELSSHGLMKAILAKLSWIILEIGVALIALAGMLNIPSYVGIIVAVVAVLMLMKGESFVAVLEVPSLFGNILSYARLMAIGLASVELAMIINSMAKPLFHQGIFAIIGGILILLLGHGLNIVLGIFGSFIHSLRLHYVEFFTKFYKGGATEYKPFGIKH
ncbi:MAG: V-type ATP synthase subunit I [bacterium]|nr:V-type ATP synthase subunit I [bacterium]